MNAKRKTILAIVIFAILIGVAYFAYQSLSDRYTPKSSIDIAQESTQKENASTRLTKPEDTPKDMLALDFTVFDANGNEVRLQNIIGKPIVLNFWATWCPYCVEEMPFFEESYKQYGEEIVFLMIDCVDGSRETKANGEAFIKDNGYTFPVYYDVEGSASLAYETSSLPTSVFIDKNGYIIAYQPGALTQEMLQMGIDLLRDTSQS